MFDKFRREVLYYLERLQSTKSGVCCICLEECSDYAYLCDHPIHRLCLQNWVESNPGKLDCLTCGSPMKMLLYDKYENIAADKKSEPAEPRPRNELTDMMYTVIITMLIIFSAMILFNGFIKITECFQNYRDENLCKSNSIVNHTNYKSVTEKLYTLRINMEALDKEIREFTTGLSGYQKYIKYNSIIEPKLHQLKYYAARQAKLIYNYGYINEFNNKLYNFRYCADMF
jgi:hypothetical protein